jgi:hypothetical protein
MIMNFQLGRMWEEVVMAYWNLLEYLLELDV